MLYLRTIMFSGGQKIFSIFFIVVFVLGIAWAYRKDLGVTKIHFKKPYLILLSIIIFLTILFLIVKMRKFL
jgi:hypothetical protein